MSSRDNLMAQTWRTVRVFISSTFRDMQAERDHLVRFVFPKLREELLKRQIHFGYVMEYADGSECVRPRSCDLMVFLGST